MNASMHDPGTHSATVANGEQRDEHGRFSPGNQAAKGRGSHAQRFLSALRLGITDDDVASIATKAVEQAREGQEAARRFVFEYLVGKPGPIGNRSADSTWATFTTSPP